MWIIKAHDAVINNIKKKKIVNPDYFLIMNGLQKLIWSSGVVKESGVYE